MMIRREMEFNDLMENCWSGAIYTLRMIEEAEKEEELMFLLEELAFEEIPTLTQINDLLWFDSEWILEQLDIIEAEEEI